MDGRWLSSILGIELTPSIIEDVVFRGWQGQAIRFQPRQRGSGKRPQLKTVEIFTDGACSGNPGPGGWACVMRFNGQTKEMWGSEPHTTNNRMELMAAISALEALKQPCAITLTTDSEYVKNGITKWIHGWKRNGWKTAAKKPVVNQDLWTRLDALTAKHQVDWAWTKGHADHPENNRCDELATAAARDQSSSEG